MVLGIFLLATSDYDTAALAAFSSLKETVNSAADKLPCLSFRISAGVRSISCASLVGSSSSNNSQDWETQRDKAG